MRQRSRSRARRVLVPIVAVLSIGPALALAVAAPAVADPPSGFSTVSVLPAAAAGPGGGPTSFAYAPDGRIFVGRKTGIVDVWDGGVEHVFIDLRAEVNSVQSRGLVGLAVDPNFAANGRVYILYTQELRPDDPDQGYPAGGQLISVTAKAADPDSADPASRVTLVTGFNSVSRLHSVAGLRFDNAGHLFVGFADGSDNNVNQGQALAAEDLDQLNGKILRIDPTTGAGIPGNPYYNAAAPTSVRSRVYARGIRNPFRFSVDPQNGNLYVGQVGWNTWEQLDVFTPTFTNPDRDRNGGWPCYEGGNGVALVQTDYETAPVTAATCHAIYKPSQGGTGVGSLDPIYGYLHDDGGTGSAIVGGPKYMGTSNYPASFVGDLFIGDYARDRMQTVDPTTGAAADFGTPGTWGAPVDIQIAPDGNVAWLGIASGELREIVYTGVTNHPPTASAHADVTSGPAAPLTVHFSSAGSSDPDPGDTLTYHWDFGDGKTSNNRNQKHVFRTTGAFTVTLTVSDGHPGGVDTATLHISVADDPPTISFSAPDPGLRYAIGDTIDVGLVANDTEDGALTGDSVSTTIVQHTGGHVFPGGQFTGTSGSFVAADLGFEDTYYELDSTATDSTGQTTTAIMNVLPATAPVTIVSTPPGLSVTVDGVSHLTPYNWDSIVGSQHEVVAPSITTVGGPERVFDAWTAPSGVVPDPFASFATPAAGATISARYDAVADGFAVSDASVVEGNSGSRLVAITVSRAAPAAVATSVAWATVDGTAGSTVAAADFKKASGTVVFTAGETSHVVTVAVKGDTVVEPDEQFSVQLSNPQGDVIAQPRAAVTVLNDDPAVPGLRVAVGDVAVLEGGSGTRSAAFTVSLSGQSPGGVSVGYATADGTAVAPGDYTPAAGTLTFAKGQFSQTVEVPVVGDRVGEASEQLTLALSNPVGVTIGRGVGTARIATDDPTPVVSISSGTFFEGDSGKPKVPFTVSLSVPSAQPVTVSWAAAHVTTDNADVKLTAGSVMFPPGALQEFVDVTTVADTTVEPDETFTVSLSNAVGAVIGNGTGLEYVRNDDPGSPPNRLAIGDVALTEGAIGSRDAEFLVTLAQPSAGPVTVHFATADGSAVAGIDYTAESGTLTFPAGAVTRMVSVPILGDSLHEGDETLTVTLSSPSGAAIAQAVGTGSIIDDD